MRRLGWARVVGCGPAAKVDASDSESVAVRYVVNRLGNEGFAVTDVQTEGQGYDLHARRGSEQRLVEVKGIAGSAASTDITLTGGEWVRAALQGDAYWLYVIDDCDNGGRLFGEYRDPAALFAADAVEITNVRVRGADLAAARSAARPAEPVGAVSAVYDVTARAQAGSPAGTSEPVAQGAELHTEAAVSHEAGGAA